MVARIVSLILIVCLGAAQLTDEEKKERAQQQKLKLQQMESCLTLVRSFYAKEETMVKQFIDVHPTQDKGRLTSKFLARMMLKCVKDITPEQVTDLQVFKHTPLELDYQKNEELIMIDWEDLRYKGDPEDIAAKRPVEMSQAESMMANQVEELSEDMRRESDLEVRKALGKTSLAFIDLQTMSTSMKTGCIIVATLIFSAIGVFFYYALFVKEVDPLKVKREKLAARRATTQKQD